MSHQNKRLNQIRQHRNFLLESMPKVLALAKKTQVKDIRSKALSLYFDKRRRLIEIEKELA